MLVVRQPGAGVEMEETHRCLFVDMANFDYAEKENMRPAHFGKARKIERREECVSLLE